MLKKMFGIAIFLFGTSIMASEQSGKISEVSFYGSGVSEVIFVTIQSKLSACPQGRYVMYSSERLGITSALLAAFQAQNTVTIYGTGVCHSVWTADEIIDYAKFER